MIELRKIRNTYLRNDTLEKIREINIGKCYEPYDKIFK